jgi:hypothetical protein
MADPDSLSVKKDNERNPLPSPSQQSEISLIPQIILTEPSTSQEPTIRSVGIDSPDGLVSKATNYSPPISLSTPLPLTKDLLQRKNKLDRLLSQKEKHRHQHRSTEVFSPNAPVDERVTAGLGISTPKNDSYLRSRRPSSSRISSSNRSEPERSMITAVSPSSQNQPSHSEWSYDLDVFKSSASGSSKGYNHQQQPHTKRTTNTSVSGSSNRNSVSMRAYSANHRYMDSKLCDDRSNHYFERPDQPLQKTENKSKYYLLDVLYCAVIRVVNSRAPESKQVSNKEIFDFGHEEKDPVIQVQDQNVLPLVTDFSNEKVILEPPSSRISTRDNRFSLISATTTSIDEKSFDFDNESLAYHTSPLEKKSSIKNDTHIPQSPPNTTEPVRSHISLTDEILPNPLQGNSLFLFGPHNPFRISVWRFIRSRYIHILKDVIKDGLLNYPVFQDM